MSKGKMDFLPLPLSLLLLTLSISTFHFADSASAGISGSEGNFTANSDTLTAVSELYGITEEEALDRLVRESDAALLADRVHGLHIPSYAGSWYDAEREKLVVAISDPDDLPQLKGLNVETVLVVQDLKSLKNQLMVALKDIKSNPGTTSAVISAFVDIRSNSIRLRVGANTNSEIIALLESTDFFENIDVEEVASTPILSTGNVRAATGTRNLTWEAAQGTE